MNKAEQTIFWEGSFGDEYTDRNSVDASARAGFFKKILSMTQGVATVLELGANKGHNLEALNLVDSDLVLTGVELNRKACDEMVAKGVAKAVCSTIQEFETPQKFDLVFSCGVLIHLPPKDLSEIYLKMFELSQKYILINEYYNPVPVEIDYRGYSERLFKRDFGGEFFDKVGHHTKLVDYGFLWQRAEPAWDNTTWWLFEKK